MRALTLTLLNLIFWSFSAHAQPWSGILDPARAIDWSSAGVKGGIPVRPTICQTLSPGATATQINTAIANCASGQVVKLNAGTYNLTSGITFDGRSDVTLRGSGPDQTFLVFTGDGDPCMGQYSLICIPGNNLGYYGPGPPTNSASWTAGYGKGTSVITLSKTTGLSVGMFIVLDQLDNTSDPGTDIYVCATTSCTDEGGTDYGRTLRQQRQMVQVASIAGTNVTISPGLYMPNWSAAKSPGAYWGNSTSLSHGNGVEDLSINGLNSGSHSLIEFIFTYDSWAKNVRGIYGPNPRSYVSLYGSARCTVRDSYFFGSESESGVGSTHYGIEITNGFNHLIENNIVQRRVTPFISDGDVGSVWAYNFAINDYYFVAPSFMQASNYSHESGNSMVLHESNQAVGIKGDIIHGTSNLFTFFRNYSIGWETGKTSETMAVGLFSYNRYWNFVGNVLGQPGYHTTYQGTNRSQTIWALGVPGNTVPADPVVATTTMRWGNYDTVSGATRWVASEVPSGISKYPNPVPATQILPNSFYLTAKPAWYASNAWPSIGPDVTGGGGPGGHVIRIPARVCFEDVMRGTATDTAPRTFNANLCYGSGGGGGPLPSPQNLRVM